MRIDLHQLTKNYRRFGLKRVFTRSAPKALRLEAMLKEDIHVV